MEQQAIEIEEYAAPRSVGEALRLASGGTATILAGGTDLMPQIRSGQRRVGSLLLSLRRIPELREITLEDDIVRIGALVTPTMMLESHLLRGKAAILPDVADRFASGQVRNSATIGGNICNASPAGDLIIPLLLLDADAELSSWGGVGVKERIVPLRELFLGAGETRIAPNEILTGVQFPVPDRAFVARFAKFGTRPALDIAVVSIGVAGRKAGRTLTHPRVAFGAVAPIPMRGRRTELVIEGREIDDPTIEAAARVARQEVSPISDVRASAWYRKELIGTLIGRLLRHVVTS